jgi:hypothetical protein
MSVLSNNTLAGSSGQGGGYEIERSLRFNSGDSANLSRTPSSSSNRNTYTYSGWVKRSQLGTTSHYLFSAQDGANVDFLGFDEDRISWYNSYSGGVNSADKFRDASAWYHVVFSVDSTQSTAADRVKIYVNNRQITSFYSNLYPSQNRDFAINHTVAQYIGHYGGSYSSNFYLTEVHFIDGQALAPTDFGEYDTNNVWQPKAYAGTYGTNGFHLDFSDTSSDAALGTDTSGNGNTWTVNNLSSGASTKPKWYTSTTLYTTKADVIANATDRGQAGFTLSSAEYVYLVPNDGGTPGAKCHPASSTYPAFFYTYSIKAGDSNWVNTGSFGSNEAASHQWDNTTNDSAYDYSNAEDLYLIGDTRVSGLPTAGASMTGSFPALINTALEPDVLRDSPSQIADQTDTGVGGEVVGNYATWNPLAANNDSLSNGNLDAESTSLYAAVASTMAMKSGKWYMEYTYTANSGNYITFGVSQTNRDMSVNTSVVNEAEDYGWKASSGSFNSQSNNVVQYNYGSPVSSGDIISLAFDADGGNLWVAKNGTWMTNASGTGNPATGANPDYSSLNYSGGYYFMAGPYFSGNSAKLQANFGQRSWAYTAPSGYKALCTANLSDPTIADGSTAFDAKLWTGNSTDNRAITGYGFSPDLVWIKTRNNAYSHQLYDSVRGAGSAYNLQSDNTLAEGSNASTYGFLASFTSDGFTLGNGSSSNIFVNQSSDSYVNWAWDAGSSNTTIAAGGLNSSLYDQSQTWSGGTTSGTISNGSWSNVFANTTSTSYADGNDVWVYQTNATINFSPALPNGAIEVYALVSGANAIGCKVTVSDGTNTYTTADLSSTSGAYYSVNNGSSLSGITSLTVHSAANSTQGMSLQGVRIGGQLLVDSGVSLANVPSIASTYRANPSAGFSIVSYTGSSSAATVGHGLNAAPGMIIVKDRDSGSWNWQVAHSGIGADDSLLLNAPNATADYNAWNNTRPTSSVFSLGGGISGVSTNGNAHIAYCFAPVEGYSAFGSYTGGGTAALPFVFTNFAPSFVLIKSSSHAVQWHLVDNKRDLGDSRLTPNSSAAEDNGGDIRLLSNGFQPTSGTTSVNTAGRTYVYMAFASHPFKNSRAH